MVVADRLQGGLPPLLCRVKADYSALPPAVMALLQPLEISVAPSAREILDFSRGVTRHLVIPADNGRYALEAMASVSNSLSGIIYASTSVLADGTVRATYLY